jgi:hypothetical protein
LPFGIGRRAKRGEDRRRRARQEQRPEPQKREPSREGGLRELLRVTPHASVIDVPRLNLIVPSTLPESSFGGIQTGIEFFLAVGRDTARRRIISVDELRDDAAALLEPFRVVGSDDDSGEAAQLVSIAGTGAALRVGPRDAFIATFWPTAAFAADVLEWQRTAFGRAPARFAYLIQDFEPGFYPRSAQSILAAATYEAPGSTIAVYNSMLLRDEFHGMGLQFDHEFVFAPRIASGLREAMRRPPAPRTRQIVVYGRPSKARNGFPLIVEGLRAWRRSHAGKRWSVVSVGEPHVDIDLGDGLVMRSLGKLDLRAYGDLLRRSAVGVSLMFSPHPSYPPMEMAVLGLLVLTNRFGGKDLSSWHTNISSLATVSPDGLAADLADLCGRFDADNGAGAGGELLQTSYLAEGSQFPFAPEVASLLNV